MQLTRPPEIKRIWFGVKVIVASWVARRLTYVPGLEVPRVRGDHQGADVYPVVYPKPGDGCDDGTALCAASTNRPADPKICYFKLVPNKPASRARADLVLITRA